MDMVISSEPSAIDAQFYQPATEFFSAHPHLALTYDDVTLATLYSEILPRDTQLDTVLAEGLHLNIPILSSDMDTVTEAGMAIAMALNGALGLIHYNMPEKKQLSEVSRVKNHVHGLIQDPIKVAPEQFIGDVLRVIDERRFAFSTFPVVDASGKLRTALQPRRQASLRQADGRGSTHPAQPGSYDSAKGARFKPGRSRRQVFYRPPRNPQVTRGG
jgi:IMP dehydrogenase